jgi:hypothetical protein
MIEELIKALQQTRNYEKILEKLNELDGNLIWKEYKFPSWKTPEQQELWFKYIHNNIKEMIKLIEQTENS